MTVKQAREIRQRPDIQSDSREWACQPSDPIGRTEAEVQKRIASSERQKRAQDYRDYIPCILCARCLIVRELRMGQLVNTGFCCTQGRFNCSAYGTCVDAMTGKRGPMVLVKTLTGDEPRSNFGKGSIPSTAEAARMERKQIEELEHGSGE